MFLIALLAGITFGLLAYWAAVRFSGGRFKPDWTFGAASKPVSLRKKLNPGEIEGLQQFLAQRGFAEKLSVLLKAAKWNTSVSIFVFVSALIGLAICFLARFWMGSFAALVAGVIAAFVPFLYLNHRRKRYLEKFAEYLPNALSIISGSIRTGHSLESAMEAVAKTAPYPLSEEFSLMRAEMRLGVPLQKALDNLYHRVRSNELKILITGIAIHQELGGNLSEILDNLEKTIRERFTITREIHTLSAQGRYSSWVLLAIPIGLVLLYFKNNPQLFLQFVKSSYGGFVIWIALGLDLMGFLWIRSIIKLRD